MRRQRREPDELEAKKSTCRRFGGKPGLARDCVGSCLVFLAHGFEAITWALRSLFYGLKDGRPNDNSMLDVITRSASKSSLLGQDKAVKEEILRIRVLAGYRVSVMIDRFHSREGRALWIKCPDPPVSKSEEPVSREVVVENKTCNMALVINARSLS